MALTHSAPNGYAARPLKRLAQYVPAVGAKTKSVFVSGFRQQFYFSAVNAFYHLFPFPAHRRCITFTGIPIEVWQSVKVLPLVKRVQSPLHYFCANAL